MSLLEISAISKSFNTIVAVKEASLNVEQGELVCLLGSSGSGKSSLLRLVAGLEELDSGTIKFNGRNLDGAAPQKRGFGLMFQDLALFPHMNVYGNVAFGLRMKGLSRDDVASRVDELLQLVGLNHHTSRRIHELSGGERQRVALARALAPAPSLLMLDEPLGALDRALRDSLQTQVRSILKEVGVTAIYVTHDRDEAFAMGDRLAFMDEGTIVQVGTPKEVFDNPINAFVARTLGFKNIVTGIVRTKGELIEVQSEMGVIFVTMPDLPEVRAGDEIWMLIDENRTQVNAEYSADFVNVIKGKLIGSLFHGGGYNLTIEAGNSQLFCQTSTDCTIVNLRKDEDVYVSFEAPVGKLIS